MVNVMSWWDTFFDSDYIKLWDRFATAEQNAKQADGIWELLGLREGSRVLDAPCGYGRISRLLAGKGASVFGVDQSGELLGRAEADRGDIPSDRLRYLRADLRSPLSESGFDAAINIFTSLGYDDETDDLAILKTLRAAVRPGGQVFVETNHRDAVAAFLSRSIKPAHRYEDDTLIIEEPELDPVSGRIETCWCWSGPQGSGKKRASLRVYTITELVKLMERAGLRFRSAVRGCSTEPFEAKGEDLGGRVGIVADLA
jgi:SAM-dependent methyltransferase